MPINVTTTGPAARFLQTLSVWWVALVIGGAVAAIAATYRLVSDSRSQAFETNVRRVILSDLAGRSLANGPSLPTVTDKDISNIQVMGEKNMQERTPAGDGQEHKVRTVDVNILWHCTNGKTLDTRSRYIILEKSPDDYSFLLGGLIVAAGTSSRAPADITTCNGPP